MANCASTDFCRTFECVKLKPKIGCEVTMVNSLKTWCELTAGSKTYYYHSLKAAENAGLSNIHRLPYSLKILLENQLRHEDGKTVTQTHIEAFAHWLKDKHSNREIAYRPARVLMQDFTGVPAVVDLAAMRDAMARMKGDPTKINPHCPIDLIIDHSVQVDEFGNEEALRDNVHIEMERNHERYSFLKWGQQAFRHFQLVPPGTGICHQVNLEYLGRGVWSSQQNSEWFAYPDTLVGTDSHTTMINGLGVLGWGVGGIEAEAAMLGQPISMLIPEVIGFYLSGQLREGITGTDLVLTVTQILRQKGVVGKFVEFYGPGLAELSLADRATIGNMAPEYGATCGLFPIDAETIKYLELTGRDAEAIELVKAYSKAQGTWHDENTPEPIFSDTLSLDLSTVEPSLAGPKRPQDRVPLAKLKKTVEGVIATAGRDQELDHSFQSTGDFDLHHGDVVIAAITSCTNTSNPSVMLAAGLLAKNAVAKGLQRKPWVKSSLAPGSKVVTDYLHKTGLINYLEKLGFYLVGYGCTTCIGNSGPLLKTVAKTVTENDLIVSSVLSGNRNFEGRIHPLVKTNWLASPPLVVAFALAGTTRIDLTKDPLGHNDRGEPIFLNDIWPSNGEIAKTVMQVRNDMFHKEYADILEGDEEWQRIHVSTGDTFSWQANSTYVKNPPFFENMSAKPKPLRNIIDARILAILGDSVTTDHISPAGAIKADSPAGKYLIEHGIDIKDFNSYGSRRGNHEVLMRGTFANIRIRNETLSKVEGGFTKHFPDGEQLSIYDAAMKYRSENIPLVVIAGKEYGTGSSRDWAAKGPRLLGVKAVVAESFERIHRSNLVGMGVLPLEFKNGNNRHSLKLEGNEVIDITGLENDLKPGGDVIMTVKRKNGTIEKIPLHCCINTQNELVYYQHGGILQFVLRQMLRSC
ncbi:aconitate hydratase AcnA [Coxiella endosymbiont of Ornithodoros amblus]|uniref:aconitate hydratase AcnA n=1 Tax=Coxiella endosymbiont of Ornithodoros amblus TaxID=1656166 RepID=UPI00244DE57F|nr:aconitate hydratase AcnA [Coxiella endosymbiont of Ornithodoros amblus]MBW5802490.1 aconitate hydratase AcnA [Coxiella endosymbiont of Ornithodoros amblus]